MGNGSESISVKIAISLVIAIFGIILSWLWLMQQQIMTQQVTDSESLGKISVLENKILTLKETGSTSAQKALVDVEKMEKVIDLLNNKVATKDDVRRIETRLDRIEIKK